LKRLRYDGTRGTSIFIPGIGGFEQGKTYELEDKVANTLLGLGCFSEVRPRARRTEVRPEIRKEVETKSIKGVESREEEKKEKTTQET